jgi:ABC-type transport system involved in multi-copper enzyme maturation permease subunit
MSTLTATTSLPPATRRAGLSSSVRSEWTKIRSVRSTLWSIAAMAGVAIGLNALINYLSITRRWDTTMPPDEQARILSHPLSEILAGPMSVAQFAVAVIGVMAISSEYATGMIRSTLQAQPRRATMLGAKLAVLGMLMFVVGEVLSFGAFFVGKLVIGSKVPVNLDDPGVLRAVFGAGLYITVLALFSFAVGLILRHTAGAITAVLGLMMVVSQLTQLLPGTVGHHIHAWMPTNAGYLILEQQVDPEALLTPWQGLGVFAGWTVLLLLVGTYLLRRRDA